MRSTREVRDIRVVFVPKRIGMPRLLSAVIAFAAPGIRRLPTKTVPSRSSINLDPVRPHSRRISTAFRLF